MSILDLLGDEATKLDDQLKSLMQPDDRELVWNSANNILDKFQAGRHVTGLALGYVQSGKTTQMMALTAVAKDRGVQLVIAFLGGTNLLLAQNFDRFKVAFDFEKRTDYAWHFEQNASGAATAQRLRDQLNRGRALFLPVLKHSGRIEKLAKLLSELNLADLKVVVIDDEADQASMNAGIRSNEESKTYAAIKSLREQLPNHLYMQFTATPYAPLLLEADNPLLPEFVEFLTPGEGYTGGKEFFVDYADSVLRTIPALDEQATNGRTLITLPGSLISALANFFVGSALLHKYDRTLKPISMLIHSSHSTEIQRKYHFLATRLRDEWRASMADKWPAEFTQERARLVESGVSDISDDELRLALDEVMSETTLWLVNSASDVQKVRWNESPYHILVGGNKLDRGFTVEGLTVTYMNRPSSSQIDTLEQRARAFGYRNDLIPYCQFFGTGETLRLLKGVVATEYDLRARLGDWLAEGGTPGGWAKQIGLLLPKGARPTRTNVIQALDQFNTGNGWHSLRRPDINQASIARNRQLLSAYGIAEAAVVNYGRIGHRTANLPIETAIGFLENWKCGDFSPGWNFEAIMDAFRRIGETCPVVPVVLLQREDGERPRQRAWVESTGFTNLFQGEDLNMEIPNAYPGDQKVPIGTNANEEMRLAIQVHRVNPRGTDLDLHTLAIYLGGGVIVRRART